MKKELTTASPIPKYYGYAYSYYASLVDVYYPIPLNRIIGWWHKWWRVHKHCKIDPALIRHRMLNQAILNARWRMGFESGYGQGKSQGYNEGFKTGRQSATKEFADGIRELVDGCADIRGGLR